MRRLRYSVAATLDGFIADPNGGYDWIVMDPSIDFAAQFAEFDAFVMGRKTWDVSANVDPADMGMADMFAGKEVFVFSRTLKSARPGITILDTDPVDTVRALKQKPGKDIWLFGGGSMFRTLVDAGLVDTVEVALMPVLLSQGVPLLAPGARITGMTLDRWETLPKSGIVLLSYSIPHV